ncbi:hypothetical protein EPUS_04093 [Endocarpon pusillum Z07020]|uniref:Uncharacterized protein n=1 Tax=Endocarpon pusillum (strain Z07020 / HMAS-L-300199) TaxID=1263415 RepID=U1HSF3_ENDPU|nr:uncharacterized protein EPUS_04093 [Endocarpon pusillum Z07020]ERF73470.1 hypothetical protein EPUS_04093 [Endocarpon pusillum Z07020]
MATQHPSYPTSEIAGKVLRRAEIAKVARNLQDRLALANFKAQNGWQNRTLRTIEPEVTEQIRRKRPYSSGDFCSDSSSNTSEDYLYYNSSPLAGPAFSDEIPRSNHSRHSHPKDAPFRYLHNPGSHKRIRSSSNAAPQKVSTANKSWKQTHQLPQSSPVFQRPQLPFSSMNQSFVSDAATIPEPRRTRSSKFSIQTSAYDDQDDLPVHSFNRQLTSPNMISSSPPRTPSPVNPRARSHQSKETGADLLLYLANSPSRSPAIHHQSSRRSGVNTLEPPSTPPSQNTCSTNKDLPSSFLTTPTTNSTNNLALFSTPGQQFNFADFVNVTPSPAQAPWGGRTPGLNKTPAAARAARRGLNFDTLVPPPTNNGNGSVSPTLQRGENGVGGKRGKGLALDLGDKLMPRS